MLSLGLVRSSSQVTESSVRSFMDGPPEGLRVELIRLVRESFPLSVLHLPENKEGVRAPSGRNFALEAELLLRDSKMYEAERNCKSKMGKNRKKNGSDR